MAALTVQNVPALTAGLTPSYAAVAAGGDTIAGLSPRDKVLLHFKNTNGATRTVTIDDKTLVSPTGASAFTPDVPLVIPATTGDKLLLLDELHRFIDPTTGLVYLTYSADAGLTVAVFKLP